MPDGNFTERQLSAAYWFVTHKILLKKILIVILIVANLTLLSFNLYVLIENLVVGRNSYQQGLAGLVSQNPDYATLRQTDLPSSLKISSLRTLANTSGFDILADINNPNAKWSATFDYQFQIGDKKTDSQKGFIFPAESKTVFDLAVANGNLASQMILTNIVWQKQIDFTAVYNDKFKFDLSNIKFIPSVQLGVGEKLSVNRVQFDVTNLSAYNYANINFVVFLNSANQLIAINQVPSGNFSSGATKSLASTFFQRLPNIDNVKIVPEVNILDSSVFLKF